MPRRALPSLVTALLGLTVLAWSLWTPIAFDPWWPWPYAAEGSPTGRVAAVWADILQPATAYLAVIGLVVTMFRCRWRDLAASMLLASLLTLSLVTVLKVTIGRARPTTPWLGALGENASFPSGHASAAAALAIAVTQATWALTRRRRPTVVAAVVGTAVAVLVAVGRLVLGVHHVSDVLAGALVAAFCAALAAALTGAWRTLTPSGRPGSVYVVWHPHRVRGQAGVRGRLDHEAARRGCPAPVWLATERDGHGVEQAHAAVDAGADLVLSLGGDGTIRQVLSAVEGRAAVGVLPAGSGNLLAKNLGIPLDIGRAMDLALDSPATPLDLLLIEADGAAPTVAAVMVGAGADAAVLADTSERGKRLVGPLAYISAGLRHIVATPVATEVIVGGEVISVDASLVTVGNVGSLHPGVALMPAADPADGRLEVLVASPEGAVDVLRMILGVLAGRDRIDDVVRLSGVEVTARFERPVAFHVDGDVVGDVTVVRATVLPGAARVVRPG